MTDATITALQIVNKYKLVGKPGLDMAVDIKNAILAERERCAKAADKVLDALQEINSRRPSSLPGAHVDADEALIEFFREIGRSDIVGEWEKVDPKWYE